VQTKQPYGGVLLKQGTLLEILAPSLCYSLKDTYSNDDPIIYIYESMIF
jgi:hypothetical protein